MPSDTIAEALTGGTQYLAARGVPEARRNARFLLAHALDTDFTGLVESADRPLATAVEKSYWALVQARGWRQPLQHLLGTWDFYGLELEVDARALIPRPDTECLVEYVLGALGEADRRVVDVGTGTGCIAIALATERPEIELLALDVDSEALALAQRNVAKHQLERRVVLIDGDLLTPLEGVVVRGTVDAIVSNPPYVRVDEVRDLEPEVREHDPFVALVAGPSGLEIFERLIEAAPGWLRPEGLLALEVGAGQAAEVAALLERDGRYQAIERTRDLGGIERVVAARTRAAVRRATSTSK